MNELPGRKEASGLIARKLLGRGTRPANPQPRIVTLSEAASQAARSVPRVVQVPPTDTPHTVITTPAQPEPERARTTRRRGFRIRTAHRRWDRWEAAKEILSQNYSNPDRSVRTRERKTAEARKQALGEHIIASPRPQVTDHPDTVEESTAARNYRPYEDAWRKPARHEHEDLLLASADAPAEVVQPDEPEAAKAVARRPSTALGRDIQAGRELFATAAGDARMLLRQWGDARRGRSMERAARPPEDGSDPDDFYRGFTLAKTVILNLLGTDRVQITDREAVATLNLVQRALFPRDQHGTVWDSVRPRQLTSDEARAGLRHIENLLPECNEEDVRKQVEKVLEAGRAAIAAENSTISRHTVDYTRALIEQLASKPDLPDGFAQAAVRILVRMEQVAEPDPDGEKKGKEPQKPDWTHYYKATTALRAIKPRGEEDPDVDLVDAAIRKESHRRVVLEKERLSWRQSPLAPLRAETKKPGDQGARLRLIDFLAYNGPDSPRFQAVRDALRLYNLDQLEKSLRFINSRKPDQARETQMEQVQREKNALAKIVEDKMFEPGLYSSDYAYAQTLFGRTILPMYIDEQMKIAQEDTLEQAKTQAGEGKQPTLPPDDGNQDTAESRIVRRRAGLQALSDLDRIGREWQANRDDIGQPPNVPKGDGAFFMQAYRHLTADHTKVEKGKISVTHAGDEAISMYMGSTYEVTLSTDLALSGEMNLEPEIMVTIVDKHAQSEIEGTEHFKIRLVSKGEYLRINGGAKGKLSSTINAVTPTRRDSEKDHAVILEYPDFTARPIKEKDRRRLERIFGGMPFGETRAA